MPWKSWLVNLLNLCDLCSIKIARFNVNSETQASWKDNFFEGVPSPAGGILVLMPLIYSKSELQII